MADRLTPLFSRFGRGNYLENERLRISQERLGLARHNADDANAFRKRELEIKEAKEERDIEQDKAARAKEKHEKIMRPILEKKAAAELAEQAEKTRRLANATIERQQIFDDMAVVNMNDPEAPAQLLAIKKKYEYAFDLKEVQDQFDAAYKNALEQDKDYDKYRQSLGGEFDSFVIRDEKTGKFLGFAFQKANRRIVEINTALVPPGSAASVKIGDTTITLPGAPDMKGALPGDVMALRVRNANVRRKIEQWVADKSTMRNEDYGYVEQVNRIAALEDPLERSAAIDRMANMIATQDTNALAEQSQRDQAASSAQVAAIKTKLDLNKTALFAAETGSDLAKKLVDEQATLVKELESLSPQQGVRQPSYDPFSPGNQPQVPPAPASAPTAAPTATPPTAPPPVKPPAPSSSAPSSTGKPRKLTFKSFDPKGKWMDDLKSLPGVGTSKDDQRRKDAEYNRDHAISALSALANTAIEHKQKSAVTPSDEANLKASKYKALQTFFALGVPTKEAEEIVSKAIDGQYSSIRPNYDTGYIAVGDDEDEAASVSKPVKVEEPAPAVTPTVPAAQPPVTPVKPKKSSGAKDWADGFLKDESPKSQRQVIVTPGSALGG